MFPPPSTAVPKYAVLLSAENRGCVSTTWYPPSSLGKSTCQTSAPVEASYAPMYAHLALVLFAGVWLPGPLVAWFQNVALRLG